MCASVRQNGNNVILIEEWPISLCMRFGSSRFDVV